MEKKSKIIIYSLVGLLLLGCAFFIFSFAYSSLESISVMGFQSRIDEFNEREKKFLELEGRYKEWQDIEKTYSQFKLDYLIPFNDYPAFRSELETLLMSNHLQVNKVSHKYRNLMDGMRRVNIDLLVVGAYGNIKKFIYEMENKEKMITFREIGMNKKSDNRIMGRIAMEVYFVK